MINPGKRVAAHSTSWTAHGRTAYGAVLALVRAV